jgi:hypothetical protein
VRTHGVIIVASGLVLASCTTDATQPTSNVDALLNQMATSGPAIYTNAALSASVPFAGAAVALPSPNTTSCSYQIATQEFDCTPVTVSGITVARTYQLLDASGHPLSIADPTSLASIRAVTNVTGTFVPASPGAIQSITVNRHEDMTLGGLRTASHVLNGTMTQTLSFGSTTTTPFTSSETSTTSNLVLPSPTAAQKWPVGGTITTDRTLSSGAVITSHEVLTFNGTSVIAFAHTSGGVTVNCTFNMATTAAPVCS